MALWQLDAFQPPQFLGFIRSVPIPQQFAGQTWLPDRTTFDLEFEYILGANQRSVMAHVVTFDSESPIGSRQPLGEKVQGELPPIKRKMRIGEKTILRHLQPRTGVPDVDQAIQQVFNDAATLVRTVQARMEWLKLQALSEDKVIYSEDGVTFQFDYGYNDDYQLIWTGNNVADGDGTDVSAQYGNAWSDTTNANPLLDLQTICDKVQMETGVRPTRMVLSLRTLNYLLTNAQLRVLIRGSQAPAAVLTRAELDTLFQLYNLPSITVYDVFVTREAADGTLTDVRTMAENRVVLLPPDTVGNMLIGPTAESRVLFGTPFASQAPGIWGETYNTTEPVAEWTKVAAVAFPSVPLANLIVQMTPW